MECQLTFYNIVYGVLTPLSTLQRGDKSAAELVRMAGCHGSHVVGGAHPTAAVRLESLTYGR